MPLKPLSIATALEGLRDFLVRADDIKGSDTEKGKINTEAEWMAAIEGVCTSADPRKCLEMITLSRDFGLPNNGRISYHNDRALSSIDNSASEPSEITSKDDAMEHFSEALRAFYLALRDGVEVAPRWRFTFFKPALLDMPFPSPFFGASMMGPRFW